MVYFTYTDRNICSITITIFSGSQQDNIPGTAHFLEHVIGRGGTKKEEALLQKLLDNLGISVRATTYGECTKYYLDSFIFNKDSEFILNIFLEYIGGKFKKMNEFFLKNKNKSIEKYFSKLLSLERNIILNEIKEFGKYFDDELFSYFYNTPGILGKIENVSDITLEDLATFYKDNYTTSNFAVFISLPEKYREKENVFREKINNCIIDNLSSSEVVRKVYKERNEFPDVYETENETDGILLTYDLPTNEEAMSKLNIEKHEAKTLRNSHASYLYYELFESLVNKHGACYSINMIGSHPVTSSKVSLFIPTDNAELCISECKKILGSLKVKSTYTIRDKYFDDLNKEVSREDWLYNKLNQFFVKSDDMIEVAKNLVDYYPSYKLINKFLKKFNKEILDSLIIIKIKNK